MNDLVPGSSIIEYALFDGGAWLTSSGRFNPLHLVAGSGSGKSRYLGRVLTWHDFVRGVPQVVVDPSGSTISNFIDKFNRWAQDYELRFWQQYKKPLPPEWVRYIEYVRSKLLTRLVYIDMSRDGSFPLYYRLLEDESLFDMAQRFVELARRIDPALETASVEGFNALYRVGTYVGMILSALSLQITEAEDLLRHPERWKGRFEKALRINPQVRPAIEFFKDYIKKPQLRARRADSFLNKILAFSADPTMTAMFGSSERSLDLAEVVQKKQTVLLDFSKVQNAERRRMLLLWVCSEVFTFAKLRGQAGREAPLGICIDEVTQILGYQQHGQSILAADMEEWVSVIARNYGLWLTIAHQNLTQIDERMQNALMQGNQMIGAISNPQDARRIAEYFFTYDPYWVKKEIPKYMAMPSKPFYDPVQVKTTLGHIVQLDHISHYSIPTIINHETEEYSIEEQLQLLTQQIQQLPRFHFLVRASGIEGQLAAPLRLLDISNVDSGIYPNLDRVAEACRRLSQRTQLNRPPPVPETATMDNKPYADANDLPGTTNPGNPLPAAPKAKSSEEGEEFQ